MVVTDLDKSSKHPTEENRWQSFIEFGVLTMNKEYTEASLQWNNNEQVKFGALFMHSLYVYSQRSCGFEYYK